MNKLDGLVATGWFRIYFNKHGAAPLMWCISPAATSGWEIAVPSIVCHTTVETRYVRKLTPDEDDGKPSAWLETFGELTIDDTGNAVIINRIQETK